MPLASLFSPSGQGSELGPLADGDIMHSTTRHVTGAQKPKPPEETGEEVGPTNERTCHADTHRTHKAKSLAAIARPGHALQQRAADS